MRRCAELEGIHQETELFFSLFRCESQYLKHLGLQLSIMDTDRTATDFNTVTYHIISIGTNGCRICVQQRNIFILRMGKRMMHSHQAAFFFAPFKHREVNYPKQCKLILVA